MQSLNQVAKSRKTLSSQQSQGKLKGVQQPPTQQILKLKAAELKPPQSVLGSRPAVNKTSMQMKKNQIIINQQKLQKILA